MEEKKKSTMRWILEWAGQKKMDYVWSVILGMGNVIFKIIPYFLIVSYRNDCKDVFRGE